MAAGNVSAAVLSISDGVAAIATKISEMRVNANSKYIIAPLGYQANQVLVVTVEEA